MLQLFRRNAANLVGIQAGKTGGIGKQTTTYLKNLHFTGSMTATAQFLADTAGLAFQLGSQRVQQCRFAHTGVAAECTQVPCNARTNLIQTFAGIVIQPDQRNRAVRISFLQGIRGGKVGFCDDNNRLHVFINGGSSQFIQNQCAGHRLGGACHNKQHIKVSNRRADKNIFAR